MGGPREDRRADTGAIRRKSVKGEGGSWTVFLRVSADKYLNPRSNKLLLNSETV